MELPENVLPVVEVLRRDVPRPTARIVVKKSGSAPQFEDGRCAMGLHATALVPLPIASFSPGAMLDLCNVYRLNFFVWWDSLTLAEAEEARDLIWPKEVR